MKSRSPALLCSFALLLCALMALPVAEIGMNDDWSYIKSAQVLAETGHFAYNGWATAMLGWQLILGALFAKFFGTSFTAIRASTLLVALLTAFLAHRTAVRAGVNSGNATVGTLALVLSPLFLPLALSFMSDIGGLFCVLLCLYACLRAVHADTDSGVLRWLVFCALSNAVGGTVRQIAWLGVLVMFPCAIWLLRRRRHVVLTGILLYSISVAIIFSSLHWFLRQPYSISEPFMPKSLHYQNLSNLTTQLVSLLLSLTLFILPILLAFIPTVSLPKGNTGAFLIIGGLVILALAIFLAMLDSRSLDLFFAPFKGNYVTKCGFVDGGRIKGSRPIVLAPAIRILFTVTVLLAISCFCAFLLASRRIIRASEAHAHLHWDSLFILLAPFSLAYLAALLPRGLAGDLFDRYILPLVPICFILLLRLFQDRVQPNLPFLSVGLVVIFAFYAVAGTHDAFSLYRAKASAVAEIVAAGVPAESIDAGFEQNGTTQLERFGYVNDPRIRIPATAKIAQASPFPKDCQPQMGWLTPAIIPGYTLSFDPSACGGLSQFNPVSYRNWLGPSTTTIYVVNTIKAAQPHR